MRPILIIVYTQYINDIPGVAHQHPQHNESDRNHHRDDIMYMQSPQFTFDIYFHR
jgi:hypothetical protein